MSVGSIAEVTTYNTSYGWPAKEESYVRVCSGNYQSQISSYGTEYDTTTSVWTTTLSNKYKIFCDGSVYIGPLISTIALVNIYL